MAWNTQPDLETAMLRGVLEVLVSAQQNESVPDTELCDERVDSANLHTRSAALVPEVRCSNVVFAVWLNQCERREPLDNLFACLGAREALQDFLQDEACGYDCICSGQSILERLDLMYFNLGIAPEGERPGARVNQERHFRERSAL
jgi:hypothetical protein